MSHIGQNRNGALNSPRFILDSPRQITFNHLLSVLSHTYTAPSPSASFPSRTTLAQAKIDSWNNGNNCLICFSLIPNTDSQAEQNIHKYLIVIRLTSMLSPLFKLSRNRSHHYRAISDIIYVSIVVKPNNNHAVVMFPNKLPNSLPKKGISITIKVRHYDTTI